MVFVDFIRRHFNISQRIVCSYALVLDESQN